MYLMDYGTQQKLKARGLEPERWVWAIHKQVEIILKNQINKNVQIKCFTSYSFRRKKAYDLFQVQLCQMTFF